MIIQFWKDHPAILYGLASLLGLYSCFYGIFAVLVPCLFLWVPFLWSRHHLHSFFLSLSLFFAVWSYATIKYDPPHLPKNGVVGTAYVSLQSLTSQTTSFGKRWNFQAMLYTFYPDATPTLSLASPLKCTLSLPQNEDLFRPTANQDYLIHCTLLAKNPPYYQLRISKDQPWQIVEGSWSLTEQRFQWKERMTAWISQQIEDKSSATFLAGLATGNFDDQWMKQEFARFGLQHIMAISGFHFAIIAGVLSLLMRLFFSRKIGAIVLLVLMAGYCFFLGSNASVLRAWLMCSITLFSYLFEKENTALNSLGVALIGVMVFDPLLSQTLAFQFSFLTTAAILLMFSPIDALMSQVFLKRPLSEVVTMNGLNQHGYVAITFFRQALSLTIAVNLFALPMTLFFFHQFPLMGILYNFFFPFLVSGSLFLLIMAFLFSFIPFVSSWVNSLNNFYTQTILKFTYQMPSSSDHYLAIDYFPVYLLVLWLCCATVAAIFLREHIKEQLENEFEFI